MKLISRHFVWVILAVVIFSCHAGASAEAAVAAESALLAKYPALRPKLEKNRFGAPIYLDSTETKGSVRVDMYGTFAHPFEAVRDALQYPQNWCDITSLHINIKACTYRKAGEQWFVTLYNGRKYYQPPADAYPLKLKFSTVSLQPNYLEVALSAEEGPLRTRDHRMRLEAAPLDPGHTFVHFSYSYSSGPMARMAIRSYFATIGRDKVGFSVVYQGGRYVYVDGVRGAIERNTVRYFLAVETYLDALDLPQNQRFEQRISRWYDLTANYPRQLKENEKGEYLAVKRKERYNQVLLQRGEGK